MIPCPVCLLVLDGYGGVCRTHESWLTFNVWLPGLWPSLEDLVDQVAGVAVRERSELLAEKMATNRQTFGELVREELQAAILRRGTVPLFENSPGVFIGFRHFRESYAEARPRSAYAAAVESIVLPVLRALRMLEHDQVEGLSHLFYELDPNESPGPNAPKAPGVQLLICDRGA